jgi:hypothetical protein
MRVVRPEGGGSVMKYAPIPRGLLLASGCYLASAGAGTALAIVEDLPARFAGILHGNDVARDFVTWRGTALSPPLALLLAQLALMGYALRAGPARTFGVAGLTLLGGAYTLGQLGEPIVRDALRPVTFNAAATLAVAANLTCSLALLVLGTREWRRRRGV